MTIVGLDMSYRHCGVAMVKYTQPTDTSSEILLLKTDCIETKPCKNGPDRITDEITQAQRFIVEIRSFIEGAEEVVVEMPIGSQDAISARYLGYCYGIIAAIELTANPDFIYISPYDLKQWSGKKKNTKEHVKKMVHERLGRLVTTKNDNIIDALGICLMRCDYYSRKRYTENHETSKQIGHSKTKQEGVLGRNPAAGIIQPSFKFMSSD